MYYIEMPKKINIKSSKAFFEGQCKFGETVIKVGRKPNLFLSMKALFILISFTCIGCTTTPHAESSVNQDKILQAKANLLACGRSLLPKIDDGLSSADVVASTIPTLCKEETNKLLNLVVPNATDLRTKEDVRKAFFSGESFVPVVLQYRASKNNKTKMNFAISSSVPSRYSECLFQLGKAWCSARVSLDLVKRSMSDSCKEEKIADEKAIRDNYEVYKDLTTIEKENLVSFLIKGRREWALKEYELYCEYE